MRHKPRKLPTGLFSWMAPTLLYPEDEMLGVAGMDSVVMSRLLMYGEWVRGQGGLGRCREWVGGCRESGVWGLVVRGGGSSRGT